MLLYATTTSERASKGQGGNKDILTVFTAEIAGQRQEVASVAIVNTEKGFYTIDVKLPDGKLVHQKISKGDVYAIKGEKKKGEYDCLGCGATQQNHKGLCGSCKGTPEDKR